MLLTPFAVIAGFAVGLLRGGRFENVLDTKLFWIPAVLGGFVIQTTAELIDVPARLTVFIIGAFLLVVGLSQNLHVRGVTIVVVGLSLNLVAVVANGHVPTRLEALIGAGKVDASIDPDTIVSIGALGKLESDTTQLGFLGDIVPIGLVNDVVSFGDLILLGGLFVVAMHLVGGRRRSGITVDDLLSSEPLEPTPEPETAHVNESAVGIDLRQSLDLDEQNDDYHPDDLWADEGDLESQR